MSRGTEGNVARDRKRKEAREEKASDMLIRTLAKIYNLEPSLGLVWREKMVKYYSKRLAEYTLYRAGFNKPSQSAVNAMATEMAELLDLGEEAA